MVISSKLRFALAISDSILSEVKVLPFSSLILLRFGSVKHPREMVKITTACHRSEKHEGSRSEKQGKKNKEMTDQEPNALAPTTTGMIIDDTYEFSAPRFFNFIKDESKDDKRKAEL
ncbi:uncharacterized protein LOC126601753 [Malus sylvestris]|uniref:uncharacterized protein LOC126601753 n=1 Tax=Malus sylvestris TaxID=3752 RepID=UPI0021AC53D6|nr:uncharacterized protein LOC126601753 [Malus sylvestris]